MKKDNTQKTYDSTNQNHKLNLINISGSTSVSEKEKDNAERISWYF